MRRLRLYAFAMVFMAVMVAMAGLAGSILADRQNEMANNRTTHTNELIEKVKGD